MYDWHAAIYPYVSAEKVINWTTTTLQLFNGLFARKTWVSRIRKVKPVWI